MFSPFDDNPGGGGDIWSTGVFSFESPLKDLLDTETYGLNDLLEQDELLQELRGLHPQLIDFFGSDEVVAGLIRHIVRSPPEVLSGDGAAADAAASSAAGLAGAAGMDGSGAIVGRPRSLSEAERKKHEEELLEEAKSAVMDSPEDVAALKRRGPADFHDPDCVEDVGDQDSDDEDDDEDDTGDDGNNTSGDSSDVGAVVANAEDPRAEEGRAAATEEAEAASGDQEPAAASYWDEAPSPSPSPSPPPPPPPLQESEQDGDQSSGEPSTKGSWLFNPTKDGSNDAGQKEAAEGGGSGANEGEPRTAAEQYELLHIRYPYMACEVICCEVSKILDLVVTGTVPAGAEGGEGSAETSLQTVEEEEGRETKKTEEGEEPANTDEATTATTASVTVGDDKGSEGERQSLLDLLFSMITSTEALTIDDRRAGYLEKTLTVLFRMRPKETTAYLNDHPELLRDLIHQTHSHSVGQIVQRLMLPPPPERRLSSRLTSSGEGAAAAAGAASSSSEGGDGVELDSSQRAFGGSGGWPMISGMDDDDDGGDNDLVGNDDDDLLDEEEEEMLAAHGPAGLSRSGWSENVHAVGWLLDRLIGEQVETEGGTGSRDRSTSDADNYWDDGGGRGSGTTADDALLDAAQNASEIVVAVVQNSSLTSPIVRSLTSQPHLDRIIDAICSAPGIPNIGQEDQSKSPTNFFPSSESTITLCMSVMESLVLQLGGYGAVPTPPAPEVVNLEEEKEGEGMELVLSTGNSTSTAIGAATTDDLIGHLPRLLSALSALLCHSSTSSWEVSNQYSPNPKPILGPARLRIVRLLESFVLLGNEDVDLLLCQSPALELCLDLFWAFPWCSMLHQSVANLLVHVLEGGAERVELQRYFINRCGLIRRLMSSFESVNPGAEDAANTSAGQRNSPDQGEGGNPGPNQPKYSEVMFALKEINPRKSATSVDSERGSDTPSDEDVLAVSEDDVEAAIEQQMQKVQDLDVSSSTEPSEEDATASSEAEPNTEVADADTAVVSPSNISPAATPSPVDTDAITKPLNEDEFRMGYMGHVIIVCQALVHACSIGVFNNGEEDALGDNDGRDGDTFDADIDDVLPSMNGTVESSGDKGGDESEGESSQDSRKRKGRSFDDDQGHEESAKSKSKQEVAEDEPFAAERFEIDRAPSPGLSSRDVPMDHIEQMHNSGSSGGFAQNRPPIVELVENYPLHDAWQAFVTTILASETAIQSTPLGGFNTNNGQTLEMNGVGEHDHRMSLTEEDLKNFMGMNDDADDEEGGMGTVAGANGAPIDLDDNDLDIAASMMEALSLPHGGGAGGTGDENSSGGTPGHHRHHHVMAGFGAVVQVAPSGAEGGAANAYLYDDPLGRGNDFDDSSSDEDVGDGDEQGTSVDDEDVPVIDLFAGNFAFNSDNAAAAAATDASSGAGAAADEDQDGGWANFDDAAFAASNLPDPTPIAPSADSGTSNAPTSGNASDDAAADVFASTPHLVDSLADDDEEDTA